jgi:hypothetical protein
MSDEYRSFLEADTVPDTRRCSQCRRGNGGDSWYVSTDADGNEVRKCMWCCVGIPRRSWRAFRWSLFYLALVGVTVPGMLAGLRISFWACGAIVGIYVARLMAGQMKE